MTSSNSLDALEVRVQNLEKNVDEIKNERREDQKLLTDTLKSLQDNAVRQTTIMEIMEQRAEKQNQRLDKMDETLVKVNLDVQAIKVRSETIATEEKNDKPNWYQNYITSNTKYFWFILLLVLGTVLGMNIQEILSFFKVIF